MIPCPIDFVSCFVWNVNIGTIMVMFAVMWQRVCTALMIHVSGFAWNVFGNESYMECV